MDFPWTSESEALFELALLWSQAGLARDEEPGQVQHEDAFKKKWPKQAGDTLSFSEELGLGKTKTPFFNGLSTSIPGSIVGYAAVFRETQMGQLAATIGFVQK